MDHVGPWRFRNLPVPEQHLVGLALSLLLHQVRPCRLGRPLPIRSAGAALLVAGSALAVWATVAAGRDDLQDPDHLVTHGAYAHSRNPMYVGWTLGYVGVAGLTNSAWPLLLLPGVAAAVHREVRREEDRLAARFGSDHHDYTAEVPRYL